jgi:AAT family amino acid transporter
MNVYYFLGCECAINNPSLSGSFNTYAIRFFSPSWGFALSWNYWFNDAVSVASDLTAAQLVLRYWTPWHSWVISLLFWVFLVGVNATHVKAYGEMGKNIFPYFFYSCTIISHIVTTEYWLASLKVATIIIFCIIGILVNVGVNHEHHYIGGHNWAIPGAPFVGGFGGFANVFVTASFACEYECDTFGKLHSRFNIFIRLHYADGGTESLGITAGETENPSKNMPRIVKLVFWRYEDRHMSIHQAIVFPILGYYCSIF